MERQIRFRGKSKENNKWVYGYYIYQRTMATHNQIIGQEGTHYIITERGTKAKIDPETIGQFIGFYDKSDREIYSNDIVKAKSVDGDITTSIITYDPQKCRYYGVREGYAQQVNFTRIKNIEIIGNIHEAELLNDGENK